MYEFNWKELRLDFQNKKPVKEFNFEELMVYYSLQKWKSGILTAALFGLFLALPRGSFKTAVFAVTLITALWYVLVAFERYSQQVQAKIKELNGVNYFRYPLGGASSKEWQDFRNKQKYREDARKRREEFYAKFKKNKLIT